MLYGPLCMNIDVVCDNLMLPPLEVGSRVHTFQAEDEPQGLLTLFLLRGLRGEADAGGDGLTQEDLARYLRRNVGNLSQVALEQPQRPMVVGKSERPADRIR